MNTKGTMMTRNNGERRSRSFNAHCNRHSSSSSSPSTNYYNPDCIDVNYESTNAQGLTTSNERRTFKVEQEEEKEKIQPCSHRLLPSPCLSSPSTVARSASTRSSRGSRNIDDHEYVDDHHNRLPRRCASTRENSRERRVNNFTAEKTTHYSYDHHCPPTNIHHLLPPRIITTIDDHHQFANRSPTPSDTEFDQRYGNQPVDLLTVPAYGSPPQLLTSTVDFQATTRSRSRSTPHSPEFHRECVDRRRLHHASSETVTDRPRSGTVSDRNFDCSMQCRNIDRVPIDRRVSFDPSCDDDAVLVSRERTRKYSCVDDRVTNLVPRVPVREYRQQELRRLVSSETPRRRFLPPTPDELVRHNEQRQQRKTDDEHSCPSAPYLDVNYGDVARKPYLLSSSSLPGRQETDDQQQQPASVRRQLSATVTSGFLQDTTDRVRSISTAANKPSSISTSGQQYDTRYTTARPGSGRKLPAEPTTDPTNNKTIPFRISRQNAIPDTPASITGSGKYSRSSEDKMLSHSSSSDEEEPDTASVSKLNPYSEIDKTVKPAGKTTTLTKFHQSSVSTSSSVPDFQLGPCHQHKPSLTITTGHDGGGGVSGVDPATDSGHGSGAESALGDGATVSASSSWPDAVSGGGHAGECKPHHLGSDSLSPSIGGDQIRRRSVITITPPLSPSACSIGVIHFTLQYFPVRKRLRVLIMRAEVRLEAELNAFVKIGLNPGKVQKQRGSRTVKRTNKEAVLNEEFFFDNVTLEDVETKCVYVRLCHHVGRQFQKDVVIGQMETMLRDFSPLLLSKQEVKTCQELKPKPLKKLGRLQITTCLEKDARRLTINIIKADELPKLGITGPPDPFIRITVDQNGWVQTKQSRILKGTCNAVFKEAVMFLVSTKVEDLERTKIVITVNDGSRNSAVACGGGDIIGYVYLGQLASDKTEMDQWRNSVTHFGREFKATHQLKRENDNAEKADMEYT